MRICLLVLCAVLLQGVVVHSQGNNNNNLERWLSLVERAVDLARNGQLLNTARQGLENALNNIPSSPRLPSGSGRSSSSQPQWPWLPSH